MVLLLPKEGCVPCSQRLPTLKVRHLQLMFCAKIKESRSSKKLMTLDLHTLNTAETAIQEAFRLKQAEWSEMAAADALAGNYANANQVADWAFAAKLLSGVVCTEMGMLFRQSLQSLLPPQDAAREAAEPVELAEAA